ncbi:hypothetical protein AURDEDRAFT_161805 [Auricularia subglabra TFB-10046 SS5]|nr:hypothetical protein AURDEDRAFT_161805 [Auricularia subglabra TFB-10046 SS5]
MPPKRKNVPFTVHTVNGPGLWVTFVRGRDHQSGMEVVDLFEELANDIWPPEPVAMDVEPVQPSGGIDDELAAELAELKNEARTRHNPNKTRRFSVIHTDAECVLFVLCRPPVDPLRLVLEYLEQVEQTKVAKLRYVQRIIPIQLTAPATMEAIQSQASKLFAALPEPSTYRIEVHLRSHQVLKRDEVLKKIADTAPKEAGHTVDLKNPKIMVFNVVFKACSATVSMMAFLPHYGRFQKYNPHSIAKADEEKDVQMGGDVE